VLLVWGLACVFGLVQVVLGLVFGVTRPQSRPEKVHQSTEVRPREVPASLLVEERRARRDPPPAARRVTMPAPSFPNPVAAKAEGTAGPTEPAGYPALVASYDAVGRDAFLMIMRGMGARLFVGDMNSRRLLAEVDPSSDVIWTGFRPVAGLAVDRPRILRDDRGGSQVLRQASVTFGPGDYAVILLVPQEVEAKILNAFQRELARQGRPPGDFVSIRGAYQRSGRGLVLHLNAATDRAGREFPLSAAVDLNG
jgi:hypothetical protein